MKVLVVDFYDSFTYNLVHYLESLDCDVTVVKNDFLELNMLTEFEAVLLSPGPGLPQEKDNLFEILSFCDSTIPVFGICLGLQGIGIYLGAKLVNQQIVKHGVQEEIAILNKTGLFQGFPNKINVGLYHSWKLEGIHKDYITAISKNGTIMALESKNRKIYAVQFHPESIMTDKGKEILKNFIDLISKQVCNKVHQII